MEVRTISWATEQEVLDELLEALRIGEQSPSADCRACDGQGTVGVFFADEERTVAQCITCAHRYVTKAEELLA